MLAKELRVPATVTLDYLFINLLFLSQVPNPFSLSIVYAEEECLL
jgi:hypothetical protein